MYSFEERMMAVTYIQHSMFGICGQPHKGDKALFGEPCS